MKKSHGVSGKPDDDDGFAALAQLESAKRLCLTRLQVRDPEQTRMLPKSIRAAPSDFEARRLLRQSALPGTRRLFADVPMPTPVGVNLGF